MKLNYDLLRELLIIIEYDSDGLTKMHDSDIAKKISFPEQKPLVFYHLKFLMDIGFIERYQSNLQGRYYTIDITPTGRSYLDSIRNESVWNKVKEKFSEKAIDIPFELIKSVGTKVILAAIGIG